MIGIGLLGHGVVGSGVVEVLEQNASNVQQKAGCPVYIKRILDLREFPDSPHKDKFTKQFADILGDPEIQVVVEVMGGVHPAYDYVKAALEAGKSAVSSNKEMIAEKGADLLAIAKKHGVNFLFEASVGGGIPLLRPIRKCLAANDIESIAGILNGTTNFILTKMFRDNMDFDEALELARNMGYAEANPAADVDGHDACRKICILASLAFGTHVYPETVPTKGIRDITKEDVAYADSIDCVIKLIGQTRKASDGKIYAMVSPALIRRDSMLSNVSGVFNAVLVQGSNTGDVLFYGKGAGKLPTASAVVADIVNCATTRDNISGQYWVDAGKDNVTDYKKQPVSFYVRTSDIPQERIRETFGPVPFLSRLGQPTGELAFLSPSISEGELYEKLNGLEAQGGSVFAGIRLLEYGCDG